MSLSIQAKTANLISTSSSVSTNPISQINFELGQKLEAKILKLNLASDTIKLQLEGAVIDTKLVSQHSSQSNLDNLNKKFSQGQKLNLIVSKTTPQIEFQIEDDPIFASKKTPQPKSSTHGASNFQDTKAATKFSLQLSSKQVDPLLKNPHLTDNKLTSLQTGQLIQGKTVAINDKQIQVQIFSDGKTNQNANINSFKSGLIVSIPLQEKKTPHQFSSNLGNLRPDIKIGDTLFLEVVKAGVKPEFLILENKLLNSSNEKMVTEIIKQSMPAQQSPQVFINQLIQVIPKLNQSMTISETLKNLAQQILQNIPSKSTLSQAVGIKQNITKSGLFLDSLLAQDMGELDINFNQDFKANLLKFLRSIKQIPTPSQQQNIQNVKPDLASLKFLQNHSESSLAKLVLNQLNSLPNEENSKQHWYLELPYISDKKAHSLTLEIEKDLSNNTDMNANDWSVTIATTLPRLGKFSCKIFSFDGIVNTYLSTESEIALKLIDENLDYLKSQFEASGIKPGMLHTVENLPEKKKIPRHLDEGLVDEKI